MAYDGTEDQNRRMDLNLYLGLPRSPRRAEPDLGSDLSLGSLPIPGEGEIQGSTEMSGYVEASDSHAPYSPSHASYSPNPQVVERLDPDENSPFEYSDYRPQPAFTSVALPIDPSDELHVHEGRSHLEYNPYSPSFIPVSPIAEAGLGPQSDDLTEPIDHAPYSPVYIPGSAVEHDDEQWFPEDINHAEYAPHSPTYVPASFSPAHDLDEQLIQDNDPPYIPDIPTTEVHTDALSEGMGFVAYQTATQTREALRREFLQYPQVRFRRLIESIESTHQFRRRFRSSIPYRFRADLGAISSGSHHSDNDETPVERSPEAHCDAQKTSLEGHAAEDLEEEKEQNSVGANFDCNICLDVAKEPVVTSCGHLFCWPCLYQWLHLHCDHKECPVCKGQVIEAKLIPIYGRGSSGMESDKKREEDGDSALKIPPRPRGQRYESLRQSMRRPYIRRSMEERLSRRVIQGEERQNENRTDRRGDPALHGVINAANHHRALTRLIEVQRLRSAENSNRAENLHRAENIHRAENLRNLIHLLGSGPSRNASELDSDHAHARSGSSTTNLFHGGGPISSSPGLSRHGIISSAQHGFFSSTSTDRFAPIAADVSSVRVGSSGNHSGASTSASPRVTNIATVQGPREAVVAADQAASASSTMAVIQGDAGLHFDAPAERNSVGSSHAPPRRRRRNGLVVSLDVDGGSPPARKRRRIN